YVNEIVETIPDDEFDELIIWDSSYHPKMITSCILSIHKRKDNFYQIILIEIVFFTLFKNLMSQTLI
ncbi:hypothetical protein, partial [Staphylococcus sp. HMSC063D03]|uniref:hypothetical protein n=1 Tax=Staphylococcus sp. HMSC063D03 TaxID=1715009 RepID=UPI001C40A752